MFDPPTFPTSHVILMDRVEFRVPWPITVNQGHFLADIPSDPPRSWGGYAGKALVPDHGVVSGSWFEVIDQADGSQLVITVTYTWSCGVDFDQNGWINGDDADLYEWAFYFGSPMADFNHDGFVNADDEDAFYEAFESGGG